MLTTEPLSYHIGHDGFIWFVGIVKDVNDTLKVGRVKVRVLGVHTEELATNDLPWAYPIQPVTQPTASPALKNEDWVFGFFLDGKLQQQPMILGVFPAIPQGGLLNNLVEVAIKTQTGL